MKVLKKGNGIGWTKVVTCTGAGNKSDGCRARLEIDKRDLFRTERHSYDGSSEYFITFKCCLCGALTDIPQTGCPVGPHELPHQKSWRRPND